MGKNKAPWRDRFLNIVERSLIELNIEFNNYSIGQTANGETKKRLFDKSVQGIEFADELTVCSAIVNDCISSPIISGDIEKPNHEATEPELKFYKIQREVRYDNACLHRADITVQRISYNQIINKSQGIDINEKPFDISYIEAKRANRYKNSTLEIEEIEGNFSTAHGFKLETQLKLNKYNSDDKFFYILVWGVWNSEKENQNGPSEYLESFTKDASFVIHEDDKKVRWIPLSWEVSNNFEFPSNELKIEKWCWVLLAQLTNR